MFKQISGQISFKLEKTEQSTNKKFTHIYIQTALNHFN